VNGALTGRPEVPIFILIGQLVAAITVLAALGVRIPDVLVTLTLVLAGAGGGITVPSLVSRVLGSSPASSSTSGPDRPGSGSGPTTTTAPPTGSQIVAPGG